MLACPGHDAPKEKDRRADQLWRWWTSHKGDLPTWAKVAKNAALLSPSSATAERVFSLTEGLFGDEDKRTLGDKISLAIRARYNDIWRHKCGN